ncbi:hypothetical protein [Prochlorococcus marinus]|uniref:hypothetical protein n=1 Tax=Prochlorococcus marinus TaxID=1219 RepID=UPI0022B3A0FD|nr:hypothetical protein [Prochlorococcus marinus]
MKSILLKSQTECQLAIGSYPIFLYDARGGGGEANLLSSNTKNNLHYKFDSETFSIPPLNSKTTKFLGMPLPPGLQIKMFMNKLEGTIDFQTGEVIFDFNASFEFSICRLIKFPNLIINTILGTRRVKSRLFDVSGQVLQKDKQTTLVGIAMIERTNNWILDSFLKLPNEALAVLKCQIIGLD